MKPKPLPSLSSVSFRYILINSPADLLIQSVM